MLTKVKISEAHNLEHYFQDLLITVLQGTKSADHRLRLINGQNLTNLQRKQLLAPGITKIEQIQAKGIILNEAKALKTIKHKSKPPHTLSPKKSHTHT